MCWNKWKYVKKKHMYKSWHDLQHVNAANFWCFSATPNDSKEINSAFPLSKWKCIKLVTLLWYIMIHGEQNIKRKITSSSLVPCSISSSSASASSLSEPSSPHVSSVMVAAGLIGVIVVDPIWSVVPFILSPTVAVKGKAIHYRSWQALRVQEFEAPRF
jgi:hypothetical protein